MPAIRRRSQPTPPRTSPWSGSATCWIGSRSGRLGRSITRFWIWLRLRREEDQRALGALEQRGGDVPEVERVARPRADPHHQHVMTPGSDLTEYRRRRLAVAAHRGSHIDGVGAGELHDLVGDGIVGWALVDLVLPAEECAKTLV